MSFGLLVLAVAALLRFAPDFRTPWRWVTPAAMTFAVVWLVVTYAFGLFVAQFTRYDATYGALAGVIVLMLWFYLTAFVLVCAAELAALPVRIRAPRLPDGAPAPVPSADTVRDASDPDPEPEPEPKPEPEPTPTAGSSDSQG